MDTQRNIPITRIAFIAILFWIVGLSCLFLPGSKTTGNPTEPTASSAPPLAATVTQAAIPDGWKLSKDADGVCQVATPSDWQLGRDFFLKAEKIDPGPFEDKPGRFPPMGLALWGVSEGTPAPKGHFFQMRTSRVLTEKVCSVWRIKADVDFTDAEKSEMEQVGATLQEVQ